jgi:hypothetical protein
MKKTESQFVVGIKNKGYGASLDLRKLYRVLPDAKAAKHGQMRVIDESGEDYLYPAEYFLAIRLPQAVEKAVLQVS